MNIEEFRTYCLSFKGVHEKMPFGKAASEYDRNILVFYVLEKWFCFVNVDRFDFCNIKCDPETHEELKERYEGIRPAYHMNKKHWISVCFGSDLSDELIRELTRRAVVRHRRGLAVEKGKGAAGRHVTLRQIRGHRLLSDSRREASDIKPDTPTEDAARHAPAAPATGR